MCGRFALYTEPTKVARFLQATNQADETWEASFNIPPTERIVGARERVDDNGEITPTLDSYRWGLVLLFVKDPNVGNRAFTPWLTYSRPSDAGVAELRLDSSGAARAAVL